MPSVDELLEKSKKKFKKSVYRPWNYMEEIAKEEQGRKQNLDSNNQIGNQIEINEESIENQLEINSCISQPAESVICDNEQAAKPSIKNKQNEKLAQSEINQKSIGNHTVNQIEKSEFNSNESILDRIFRLTGHQKAIFIFIVERCVSRGMLTTGAVTGETLVAITNSTLKMAKLSIQRLVFKDLIIREQGKTGRGGFYKFSLTEAVRNAALDYKRLLNSSKLLEINQESSGNQLVINSINNKLYDSAIDQKTFKSLPKEWEEIYIEPLEDIGFTRDHLMQLFKSNSLEPETVQASIYHFAYDLKYNNKAASIKKTTPIGYFMGILRKIGPYTAPDNYKSSKEIALEKMLEQKKIEAERIRKLNEEILKVEFDEWLINLSDEYKSSILEKVFTEKEKNSLNSLPKNMKEQATKKHLLEFYKQEIRKEK